MAFTNKYEFETISYSNTGWNGLLTTFIQKVEAYLYSRYRLQAGHTLQAFDTVYVESDGKVYQAKADGAKMPIIGLVIEDGDPDDYVRVQRVGTMVNAGWSLTAGGQVWASTSLVGEITQTEPTAGYVQLLGVAQASDTLLLAGNIITEYTGASSTTTTTV